MKKRVDYEVAIADSRYRAVNDGKPPPQEMLDAWTKEIMNQLGAGEYDIAKFRATIGEPRPAESIDRRVAYLKKQLTETKLRAKIRRIIKEAE